MYELKLHKKLSPKKWQLYSKGQQILMIGTELNRAKNWIDKKQNFETNQCYERAFELIDLTIEDSKWANGLKELLRARELLADLYVQEEKDKQLNQQLFVAFILMTPEAYNLLH